MESSLAMPIYQFTCTFTVFIGVVTEKFSYCGIFAGNTIFQTLKPTRNHYQNHNQHHNQFHDRYCNEDLNAFNCFPNYS